jgi:DNA-binding response OmpR family regulator
VEPPQVLALVLEQEQVVMGLLQALRAQVLGQEVLPLGVLPLPQVALLRAQEAPQRVLAEVLLELEATALERGLALVLAEQQVRGQELAEQVPVPGMDLDSIEPGLPGQQRRAGEILSREDIGEALGTPDAGERAIDVQVTRLRRKVEPDPREPRFIQTIRHRGYVLRPGP